jgi:putative membrane protein
MPKTKKYKQARKLIIGASIAIPFLVAMLFGVNLPKMGYDVKPLYTLPPIYATINGITAILLILALIAIKKRNKNLHHRIIQTCMGLSILFLGMYVAYHITSVSTVYGDTNGDGLRDEVERLAVASSLAWYQFILLTHILLSIVIVPIVLFTYLFAWEGNYVRHKKWARIAWPIWFYVATTGVIVYLMISPYFPN